LLALRKVLHADSLVDCTPIFLPIISWGLWIGFVASDMMQKGFF